MSRPEELEEYRQRNKENDVTEKMYISDIRERHKENRRLLEGKLRRIDLLSPKHAAFLMSELVSTAAKKLGATALHEQHQAIVKQKSFTELEQKRLEARVTLDLAKSGVVVENLEHKGIEPQWCGLYFYKNNEIAYFISAPLEVKRESGLIAKPFSLPKKERFILTNVPLS